MGTTLEPDALRDRESVDVRTETRTVTRAEFETARDLESRVTVGITNDAGEILLVDDGPRGWTLPAMPVGPDEDWGSAARRVLESLTGRAGDLAEPIRVREVAFRREDDAERRHTTYDVLVRTTPLRGRPIADEPTVAGEDVRDLVWLDRVPEGAEAIATDVESVLERSDSA